MRVILESDAEYCLEPGEELTGEILLHQWKLVMKTRVVRSMVVLGEPAKTISVLDPIDTEIERSDGRERFRLPACKVNVTVDSRRITGRLIDASVRGLGIWIPEALNADAPISCQVSDDAHVFDFEGAVRYSVADGEGFRCGLELQNVDRVNRSKWDRFIIQRNRRERPAA